MNGTGFTAVVNASVSIQVRLAAVLDNQGKEAAPSVIRMCELLQLHRSSVYAPGKPEAAKPKPVSADDEARMAVIDEMRLQLPATGARKMAQACTRRGLPTKRSQAVNLMRRMHIRPVYPKPQLSRLAKDK